MPTELKKTAKIPAIIPEACSGCAKEFKSKICKLCSRNGKYSDFFAAKGTTNESNTGI
jgi:hypothetical protein